MPKYLKNGKSQVNEILNSSYISAKEKLIVNFWFKISGVRKKCGGRRGVTQKMIKSISIKFIKKVEI